MSRGQGLGKALVAEILATADPNKVVYLITITSRRNFYEQCGFQEVSSSPTAVAAIEGGVPLSLRIEKMVGSPIAQLAAQDSLIIMKWNKTKI
jgi:GNAT superfamily N-acetyltransferase